MFRQLMPCLNAFEATILQFLEFRFAQQLVTFFADGSIAFFSSSTCLLLPHSFWRVEFPLGQSYTGTRTGYASAPFKILKKSIMMG
ncbi:hypothetical protein K7X08_019157 [Anisodus acutangulus]|uniref:Uncharacterized protein n=1 Tax=Anisodus acutangulus TaxID=402998 RepID=A0A9Q1MVA3_9SOLA|nr:hypothetical protein K7X08_019157 [Anisodus acutangulus]